MTTLTRVPRTEENRSRRELCDRRSGLRQPHDGAQESQRSYACQSSQSSIPSQSIPNSLPRDITRDGAPSWTVSGDRVEPPNRGLRLRTLQRRVDSGVLRHGIKREGLGAPGSSATSPDRAIDVADQSPDHRGLSPVPWGCAEVSYATKRVAKEQGGGDILRSSPIGKYSMASAGSGKNYRGFLTSNCY
jgi:hypothetical protein